MLTGLGLANFGPAATSPGDRLVLNNVGGVGAVVALVGLLVNVGVEADGTRAVGACNRWLWDALALPRAPEPLVSPAGLTPSALTPWVLAPGSPAPAAALAPASAP